MNKDENIDFITNYLSEKGINYYLRDLRLNEDTLAYGQEIEAMMTKTKGESKLAINEELLNMYKEVV